MKRFYQRDNRDRNEKRPRINHQIKVPEVDTIDDAGNKLGIISTSEAIKMAMERGLDLVEINPLAKPPLAKIMDFGKYMYQKEKRKDKGTKNKSLSQEVKTIKVGFRTESHDLNVRATQVDKFLKKGYRVSINMVLKGREKAMRDLAREKLENFIKLIQENYEVESFVKSTPNGFVTTVKPAKKKQHE